SWRQGGSHESSHLGLPDRHRAPFVCGMRERSDGTQSHRGSPDQRSHAGAGADSAAMPSASQVHGVDPFRGERRARRDDHRGSAGNTNLRRLAEAVSEREVEKDSPLRLGPARLKEARVLSFPAVPRVASPDADRAEKRDAGGASEVLESVRVGNSVVRAGPDNSIAGGEDLAATAEDARRDSGAAPGSVVVIATRLRTREVDRLDAGERYHEDADIGHGLELGAKEVSRKDSGAEELRSEDLRLVVEVFVLL